MPFLKYLNDPSRQTFAIPPSAYSWISQNVTKSFSSFKFDLYDKFAIINLAPNYASNELIWLISNYIQSNMPLDQNGNPYTFTTFIS